jgi:hypothetical protein
MSDQAPRQIEVKFALNRASFNEVTKAIDDLIAKTKELGTLGGGGLFGGGARTGGGGQQGGSRAPQGGSGGTQGPGNFGDLTKVLNSNKDFLRNLTTESKTAASAIAQALKQSIDEQKQSLKQLESQLDTTATSFQELTAKAKETGKSFDTKAAQQAAKDLSDAVKQVASAKRELGSTQQALGGVQGSGGGIGGFLASGVRGVFGALGAPITAAAFGAAAIKANDMGEDAFTANMRRRNDMHINSASNIGDFGSAYGGMALRVKNGRDLAASMAYQNLSKNGSFKDIDDRVQTKLDIINRAQGRDTNGIVDATVLMGQSAGQGISSLNDVQLAGQASGRGAGAGTGRYGNMTQSQMDVDAAKQKLASEAGAEKAKMVDDVVRSNPVSSDISNRFYNEAMGRIGAQRAGGLSMRGYDKLEASALSAGYDPSEWVGSMRQAAGSVGWKARGQGPRLLGAQYGGLSNSFQAAGIGAQFSSGNDFYKGLQNSIGSGGVDQSAGSRMADIAMTGMTSGNFQGSGESLISSLANMTNTGSAGGDMSRARQLAGGMSTFQSELHGIDPARQAYNRVAAFDVAGKNGLGMYAAQALNHMEPAQLLEMSKGGLSQEMKDLGFKSTDPIKDYLRQAGKGRFSGLARAGLSGDLTKTAVDYDKLGLEGMLKGKKGAARDTILGQLGELKHLESGESIESASTSMRAEAEFLDPTGTIKASGAHASGAQGAQKSVAGNEADRAKKQSDTVAANQKDLAAGVKKMRETVDQANAPIAALEADLRGLAKAIEDTISFINNKIGKGGAPKTGAPTGKK